MLNIVLVTYFVYATGEVREVERIPMAPVVASLKVNTSELEMCHALKHQREFTHYTPPDALGVVHLCKEGE